ncbi:MAG: hypothetical protein WCO03_00800 [bacterium]
MQEYTREQLREFYLQLPEPLQDIMVSLDTAETIEDIGKKHGLHVDKIGILGKEIDLVMMGLVKPQDFTLRLEKRLLIPSKDAVAITMDVNDKILFKINDLLRQLGNRQEVKEEETPDLESLPPDNSKLTSSIFEQKMGGLYTQSKQENKPRVNDPYREPTN